CVVGGENVSIQASGAGETDLALRSLSAQGRLEGQFQLQRSRVEGLLHGIDNSITTTAAQQATEARRCLEPLRARLLTILLIDRSPPQTSTQSSNPETRQPVPPPPTSLPAGPSPSRAPSAPPQAIEPRRTLGEDTSAFVYR